MSTGGGLAPAPATPSWRVGAISDTGVLRDHNEDVVVCEPEGGFFAVIDGVGGEVAGEVGAREAAAVVKSRLERRLDEPAHQAIAEAVALANNRLVELQQGDPSLQGMSCVMTVAVMEGKHLFVGHVGDTRLLILEKGRLRKLTRDHSPVGQMEESGELSELEAMRHPRRNEIYRDVGSAWHRPDDEEFIDLFETTLTADSAFILCSDGLTDQVTSREIREIVESLAGTPLASSRELVRVANAAGGKDNVSVIVVEGPDYASTVSATAAETDSAELRMALAEAETGPHNVPRNVAHARRRDDQPKPAVAEASPLASQESPPQRHALRGAGRARSDNRGGLLRSIGLVLLGVLVSSVLFLFLGDDARRLAGRWIPGIVSTSVPRVLSVGEAGSFDSIAAALSAARPGDVVEVAPGEYSEKLVLPGRVTLRSRIPRAAVLRAGNLGTGDHAAAVEAVESHGSRIEGFRIVGDATEGLSVGIRLVDSNVVVENVEISATLDSAIESLGADRSTIRYSEFRENVGSGLVAGSTAAPVVVGNRFERNGRGQAPAAAVDLRGTGLPVVRDNRFTENGVGIWTRDARWEAALRSANRFIGEGLAVAVRTDIAATGE